MTARSLKKRVGTTTFTWDDQSIQLQGNFAAMESLADDVGMDPLVYIQTVKTQREMAKVFYHLQYDTDWSLEDIYNAFFANATDFIDEEYTTQIAVVYAVILGADKAKMLDALAQVRSGSESEKKEAA